MTMKKKNILIISLLFLALFAGIFYYKKTSNKAITSKKIINEEISEKSNPEIIIEEEIKKQEEFSEPVLPDSVLLKVPFMSQAPFAKWDALHEDACEEASLIMLKYFSDGKKTISKELAEEEIQNMIAFEKKNKYGISITLDELSEIARKYYNLKTGRVEKNITINDIKKELSDGKPVIVGAAGKVLPNPNFKNGGPIYHMLVVVGYDEKGFITNDPGTRLGEGFRYYFDDLLESIHDWDAKNILSGGKNYLVLD